MPLSCRDRVLDVALQISYLDESEQEGVAQDRVISQELQYLPQIFRSALRQAMHEVRVQLHHVIIHR